MLENNDILKELENSSDFCEKQNNQNKIKYNYETIVEIKKDIKRGFNILSWIIVLFKYTITSSLIFGILLITTNYSAYINIAKSYILKEQVETTSKGILNSVEASNLKEKIVKEKNEDHQINTKEKLSIKKYKKELESSNINLNIEITPYIDRVIIPKIGKNVPLIDIKNQKIEGEAQLNDIFMKELEKGIIRYPGSSKPGEEGTSFIFGHSSNFPWMKGDYNDVFSTLDNVEFGDEVIVYYGQKKHTYKIKQKKVITPGDVSVLKKEKDKSKITLMTCWPIGTTLNRLIVTGELIEN